MLRIVNGRASNLLAVPLISDVPSPFRPGRYSKIVLTTLHRKKEKKKEEEETPLYMTGYVISPSSHFDETSEIPEGPPAYLFLWYRRANRMAFQLPPGAAAHNEFRRASKGARSARKAHVVEFNLHVFGKLRSAGTRTRGHSLSRERCRCSIVRKLIGSAGRETHADPALVRSVSGAAPKIPGLYAIGSRQRR